MLINPETWRKASRLNRLLLLRIALYAGMFFALCRPVLSDENVAILIKGPVAERGIRFLSANAVSYDFAEYEFREHLISIYLSRETDLPLPLAKKVDCGVYVLQQFSIDDGIIVFFSGNDGLTVFIEFPEEFDDVCLFSEQFLKRFQYFMQITDFPEITQFPAVLEFRS
jgi:hypothetical protein